MSSLLNNSLYVWLYFATSLCSISSLANMSIAIAWFDITCLAPELFHIADWQPNFSRCLACLCFSGCVHFQSLSSLCPRPSVPSQHPCECCCGHWARVEHEIPGLIKPTGTDGPLAVSAVCQPYTATLNRAKCLCRGGVWELGPRAEGIDLPDVISCGK